MPFSIIRNDITCVSVDAIVNAANPMPVIGHGVETAIYRAAGPQLLTARQKVGAIRPGSAAITPAFLLPAKYVIHTVSPVWQGGDQGEEKLLADCYREALTLAQKHHCHSIAFPLLAAGNLGFPGALALKTALLVFQDFLLENEMEITLVVFDRASFILSEKLSRSVESYIDEHYIEEKLADEYDLTDQADVRQSRLRILQARRKEAARRERALFESTCAAPSAPPSLDELLAQTDAGFSETLLALIDRTGKKDSDIYRKAFVDRKLFSKIRNNPAYRPTKQTVVAFAFALELSLDETKDLLARAGYSLTHASVFDIIVEYFLMTGNYNILELDAVLFDKDQPLVGS